MTKMNSDDQANFDAFESFFSVIQPMVMEEFGRTHPSREVFHYTTASAALKIIESGKLWATDIHFLNDSSEWNYTVDVVISALGQHPDINEVI